jgi:hypothetical protein
MILILVPPLLSSPLQGELKKIQGPTYRQHRTLKPFIPHAKLPIGLVFKGALDKL